MARTNSKVVERRIMDLKFTVWHRKTPTFLDNRPWELSEFPTGWDVVAWVETDHVGHVFELTNHIDHNWTLNDGVRAQVTSPRSSSVGDIITEGFAFTAETPDYSAGKCWSIQMIGLKEF